MFRTPRPKPTLRHVALLTLAAGADLSAQPYSLDDWMTISQVDAFVWAPDGRTIYYTSNAAPSGTAEIFAIAVDGGAPRLLERTPDGVRPEPAQDLTISADGSTLYFAEARYFQTYTNLYRMPTTGGVPEALTFNDAMIQTGPAPSPDGRVLAYWGRTGAGSRIFTMFTGDPTWSWTLFGENDASPIWGPDGSLAFRRQGDIWVLPPGGSEPRRVIESGFAGGNGGPAWSPDGTRLAFTRGASGFTQIGVVEVATGEVTPITYEANEHSGPAWSPDGAWVAYTRNDDVGMSQDLVLARSDGSGEPRVLTTGKGQRSGAAFSPDGATIAYIESTSTRAPDVWLLDVASGRSRQLTHSMGAVDPGRLVAATEAFYAGPDGLPIPTMVWLPPGFDRSRRYPVLVRLHGHPGQWNHGFRMMTQYFVQRGFVAVAPNPRGSRGFGDGFHDLHIADYGGVELQDVMGVVPFLDSLGYVDMDRKATWGGSGGGYMSFVIATEAPDAFEAQVIRAPVSDWQLLAIDRYGASGRHWTAGRTPRRERSEFGGSYEEIPEEYERRSPVNYVEHVVVPQLLLHGLRDTSVPPRQSRVWVDAMADHGNRDLVDYVEYPDEVHSLRRYKATIRDRIERMERFLEEHLRMPGLAGG